MTHECPRCHAPQPYAGNCRACVRAGFFVSVRPHHAPEPESPVIIEGVTVPTGEPCHFCSRPYPAPAREHDNPRCPRYTGPTPEPAELIVSAATRPRVPSHERFNCYARAFALAAYDAAKGRK